MVGAPPLLEATTTRVRLRQESFFVSSGGTILGGVKTMGDHSVYATGRLALGWERKTTSSVTYTNQQLQISVHKLGSGPLNGWAQYRESGLIGAGPPGTDDFTLSKIEASGAKTDFLQILYQDWAAADTVFSFYGPVNEYEETAWQETNSGTLPANENWHLLYYFKPTNLIDNTDPAVTGRVDDYRPRTACATCGPDDLATPAAPTAGGGWFHPSENTAGPSDFYNESEAVYALEFDMANGLTFDIDGGLGTPGTPIRYEPFFKIRQWRSFQDPAMVTLEGTTLNNDAEFKTDLKPVSRAHFAQDLLWHSSLQDAAAVTSPDVGSAGTVMGTVTFVKGRYGDGAQVSAINEIISFPTTYFDKVIGAFEFWFQPNFDNTDGTAHTIAGFYVDGSNHWLLRKEADNSLSFKIVASGATSLLSVSPANYSWRTSDWLHLRIEWDESAPLATQQRLYINGVEPPHTDPALDYIAANLTITAFFDVGKLQAPGGPSFAPGIYDEVRSYGGSSTTPTPLAHGGLTSDSNEYLANATLNFQLAFDGVDGNDRGEYAYFGADSQFRGLNIALSAVGTGVGAGDLVWEYWNGTTGAWDDLEAVLNFTDETDSLTKVQGTVYWEADPANWAEYSVNGSPDLYYIRAHLVNGASYTTAPTEALIKTDILLFQYCGDITAAAQTFDFALPIPTAVELSAFEAQGVDKAIELSWQTASELNNLGFHLYRATSRNGAYERLTETPIPGLGSSPVGASYSYRDVGLTNGVTYYYELEDIETTGKTDRHGPVSATPQAGATPSPESGQVSGGDEDANSTGARITFGKPEQNTLRVVRRSRHDVVLELVTEGFYADALEDGTVRLVVPGLETLTESIGPDVPVKRTWVEAVAGRKVKLASVKARRVEAFAGLRPSDAELPEIVATPGGTIRAARRRAKRAFRGEGLSPSDAARIVSVGFQGEAKKALVELAPLRWDQSTGQLLLARRLVVRLSFRGREPSELTTDGVRGRR